MTDGATDAAADAAAAAIEKRVLAALDGAGAAYEAMPCDPAFADTVAFCERYGVTAQESANTIIVASRTEPKQHCVCVLTADRRLDVNGAVRKRMGVRKASFASADETRALTGMMIGGVTPFALPDGLPLYVDTRVLEQPTVVVGGGSRSLKIRVAPSVLVDAFGGQVVPDLTLPR